MNTRRSYPVPRPKHEAVSPSGPVKVTYDPSAFTWHDYPGRVRRGEKFITVTKNEIVISSAAAEVFADVIRDEPCQVIIGTAPKAIAIRPAAPGEKGWKVRKEKKSSALRISCYSLIAKLGWPIPTRLPAVWDEEHGILVGRMTS